MASFLWVVLAGALSRCRAAVSHDVSAACRNAAITAPRCLHNSTLYAFSGSPPKNSDADVDNCATCVCALATEDEFARLNALDGAESSWGRCCDGWTGTDCGVCDTADACPPRTTGGGAR